MTESEWLAAQFVFAFIGILLALYCYIYPEDLGIRIFTIIYLLLRVLMAFKYVVFSIKRWIKNIFDNMQKN